MKNNKTKQSLLILAKCAPDSKKEGNWAEHVVLFFNQSFFKDPITLDRAYKYVENDEIPHARARQIIDFFARKVNASFGI